MISRNELDDFIMNENVNQVLDYIKNRIHKADIAGGHMIQISLYNYDFLRELSEPDLKAIVVMLNNRGFNAGVIDKPSAVGKRKLLCITWHSNHSKNKVNQYVR